MTTTPGSMAVSPLTLAAMFGASEPILGGPCHWRENAAADAATIARQIGANLQYRRLRDLALNMLEIKTLAAWTAEEVNAFLRANGFDIALEPFPAQTFGIAAVSDFLVMWETKLERTTFLADILGRPVDAFVVPKGMILASSRLVDPSGTFWIRTQTDDLVGLSMAMRPAGAGDLLRQVQLRMALPKTDASVQLHVPCVDLNVKPDVSYLLGMHATPPSGGPPAIISQAVMQAMFRMNEHGARAKVAMAAAVTRGFSMPPDVLKFDRPFLAWIERPDVDVPLAAFWIDPADWKDPGEL